MKLSTTKRYKDKQVSLKYFRCSAEGKTHSVKKTKTPSPYIEGTSKNKRRSRTVHVTRSDCNAGMCLKYCRQTKLFTVEWHHMNHTHPYTRPEWQYLHRVERKIDEHKASAINVMEVSGMRPTVAYKYISTNALGRVHVGHTKRDHLNHINRLRSHETGGADAQNVVNMLHQRQQNDPQFFYEILLDDESRLCGLFWADGMMREDYNIFGDVVVFDTTFRTNRYELVCAPIVEVNNHWSNTMFGWAFLANEQTETFV